MRKIASVVLLSLVGMWGVAQAEDGFNDLFDYYAKNSLEEDEAYQMMVNAWGCEQDAVHLRMGAGFKSRGLSYEDITKDETFKDDDRALIIEGFEYDGPFDKRISRRFTQCMIEHHKAASKK